MNARRHKPLDATRSLSIPGPPASKRARTCVRRRGPAADSWAVSKRVIATPAQLPGLIARKISTGPGSSRKPVATAGTERTFHLLRYNSLPSMRSTWSSHHGGALEPDPGGVCLLGAVGRATTDRPRHRPVLISSVPPGSLNSRRVRDRRNTWEEEGPIRVRPLQTGGKAATSGGGLPSPTHVHCTRAPDAGAEERPSHADGTT